MTEQYVGSKRPLRHLVVKPGAAIGLAALLAGKLDVKGKVAVSILSGGNVDADLFAKLIAG